jgi:hypothetical protein
MKLRRAWVVTMLVSMVLGEGCTSLREIPPGDYAGQVPQKAVRVVTVDSLRYELDSATIVGDTLVGYRRKDVELLLRIKQLLYDRRFTIEGARQALQAEARTPKPRVKAAAQRDLFSNDPLPEIRRELSDILQLL